MDNDKLERKPDQVNTGGGVYINGDVTTDGGDFVGRDKVVHGDIVNGDKVERDKNVFQTFINYISADREQQREFRNRQAMLNLMRNTWIKGVLEHSLYNEILIDLRIEERVDAIKYPLDVMVYQSSQPNYVLPRGTRIVDVFDKSNQALLILGEPGSGKTTMMLELAKDTIDRAEKDPAQHIPVIFNLSSWVVDRKPIADWLLEELNTKYNIPNKVGRPWLENDDLFLLLDGLDEVSSGYREECVMAINEFRKEHMMPLVVCSRTSEYEELTIRLKLQGAILLQPLSYKQIDDFLERAGTRLSAFRTILRNDIMLQDLIRSPLMLSILSLSYQDVQINDLRSIESPSYQRKQVFDYYVNQMLIRQKRDRNFNSNQILHWLNWIAQKMDQYCQSEFLIERIQPTWLPSRKQKNLYFILLMLIIGIPIGLIFGYGTSYPISITGLVFHGRIFGIGIGLTAMMAICLAFINISCLIKGTLVGVTLGLSFGITFGLFYPPSVGLYVGLIMALISGIIYGLICLQLNKRSPMNWDQIKMVEKLRWSWKKAVPGFFIGLAAGFIFGLTVGITIWRPIAILFGITFGISAGMVNGILSGLTGGEVDERTKPNSGIWQSARNAFRIGSAVTVAVGLPIGIGCWLASNAYFGPFSEVDSLSVGIVIGLSSGITFGLAIALFFGGFTFIQHYLLRLFLYYDGYISLNFVQFLDHAVDLIFLRKVGGGYIFPHKMLMDYFSRLQVKP